MLTKISDKDIRIRTKIQNKDIRIRTSVKLYLFLLVNIQDKDIRIRPTLYYVGTSLIEDSSINA